MSLILTRYSFMEMSYCLVFYRYMSYCLFCKTISGRTIIVSKDLSNCISVYFDNITCPGVRGWHIV